MVLAQSLHVTSYLCHVALIAQMQANGFRVVTEHTFLPYQYFLAFGLAVPAG